MFVRKITKNGNCVSIVLPKAACKHLGIGRGDYMALQVIDSENMMITKINPVRRPDLAILLDKEIDV